ncbi:hypothetical protein N1851_028625 [Merluccius polli]|uniref:Uncharacterized protein n=1 Tax=Merluccius polli TaxID=89951 RepID=A0AA47M8J2_MERPO|nr:hypothetical protein N1851_028625 [Merluccius polli]
MLPWSLLYASTSSTWELVLSRSSAWTPRETRPVCSSMRKSLAEEKEEEVGEAEGARGHQWGREKEEEVEEEEEEEGGCMWGVRLRSSSLTLCESSEGGECGVRGAKEHSQAYRDWERTRCCCCCFSRLSSKGPTVIMNTSYPGFNVSSPSLPPPTGQGSNLSSLTTTLSLSTPIFSDAHDPEVTIMVVLGLAVLLAGVAAFLALCRSSEQGRDSEGGVFCGPRDGLGASGRSGAVTSEPQLKVWKRLGSYRRSYNTSFRRPPPPRRTAPTSPRDGSGSARSPARQTLQPESCGEPHAALPCLFDYVTEI